MARHVFYSLHYDGDRSRAAAILGSSTLVAQLEAKIAEWDKITRAGDFAIKRWVENQLKGRSCTVVLIGAQTASRPKIQYEIKRSHELGLGLLGIHVHALKDAKGRQGTKGANPFEQPGSGLGQLAGSVPVFDPPETDSNEARRYILEHIAQWADESVALTKSAP